MIVVEDSKRAVEFLLVDVLILGLLCRVANYKSRLQVGFALRGCAFLKSR